MRCCPASNYIHDDSTARSFVQLATVKYDRPPEIAVEIVGKIDSFVIAAAAALFSGSSICSSARRLSGNRSHRRILKLFKTGSIGVVKDCQSYFAIDLPSCDLKRRQDKFMLRYISTVNGFCQFCNEL